MYEVNFKLIDSIYNNVAVAVAALEKGMCDHILFFLFKEILLSFDIIRPLY